MVNLGISVRNISVYVCGGGVIYIPRDSTHTHTHTRTSFPLPIENTVRGGLTPAPQHRSTESSEFCETSSHYGTALSTELRSTH